MKWLKKLDRKLESVVNQIDRTASEPVLKVLSGEVFTNDPGEPVLYEVFTTHPKPTADTADAAQSATASYCQPTRETA